MEKGRILNSFGTRSGGTMREEQHKQKPSMHQNSAGNAPGYGTRPDLRGKCHRGGGAESPRRGG